MTNYEKLVHHFAQFSTRLDIHFPYVSMILKAAKRIYNVLVPLRTLRENVFTKSDTREFILPVGFLFCWRGSAHQYAFGRSRTLCCRNLLIECQTDFEGSIRWLTLIIRPWEAVTTISPDFLFQLLRRYKFAVHIHAAVFPISLSFKNLFCNILPNFFCLIFPKAPRLEMSLILGLPLYLVSIVE